MGNLILTTSTFLSSILMPLTQISYRESSSSFYWLQKESYSFFIQKAQSFFNICPLLFLIMCLYRQKPILYLSVFITAKIKQQRQTYLQAIRLHISYKERDDILSILSMSLFTIYYFFYFRQKLGNTSSKTINIAFFISFLFILNYLYSSQASLFCFLSSITKLDYSFFYSIFTNPTYYLFSYRFQGKLFLVRNSLLYKIYFWLNFLCLILLPLQNSQIDCLISSFKLKQTTTAAASRVPLACGNVSFILISVSLSILIDYSCP